MRDALAVTVAHERVANVLILGFGTPAAWLLATRRFRGPRPGDDARRAAARAAAGGRGHRAARRVRRGRAVRPELRDAGIVLPFSQWAVVLAITFVASPFYLRQAIAAFEGVDPSSPTPRARSAPRRARTFRRVALPLAAGGLAAGWVLAFARGVGEFGATIIFAGNVHGQTQTLTLAVYEELDSTSTWRWRSASCSSSSAPPC